MTGRINNTVRLLEGDIPFDNVDSTWLVFKRNHCLLRLENNSGRHRINHFQKAVIANHFNEIGDLTCLLLATEVVDDSRHFVGGDKVTQNVLVCDIQRVAKYIDEEGLSSKVCKFFC